MTKDEFHAGLRQFMHRFPFHAFSVVLRDGRRIIIHRPEIAFCDGAASFIDPIDESLVEFYHIDVQAFEHLEQELRT